jgi:anti-sigma factor RsiW
VSACADVRPDLGAYVLGALEPEEMEAVREHLSRCAPCAAEHARLAGLPELLALAAPVEDVPLRPAVEERVLDAVAREAGAEAAQQRRPARPGFTTRRVLAGALALAAAAAVALVIALPGGGDPPAGEYEIALRPVAGSAASGRVQLAGTDGGTSLHLWVSGLPADPGVVYEVECDAPGWTASAGTFRADSRGRAYVVLTTAARRGEYDAIRVVRRSGADPTDVLKAQL